MNNIVYVSLEQAIEIYETSLRYSRETLAGVLNSGQLDSILCNIQNDVYYPTFLDKLTHLIWGICKFHCFIDGNKRAAIWIGTQFLLSNGYEDVAELFPKYIENICCSLAENKMDKDLLKRILASLLNDTHEYDDILRYDIYRSIDDEV